MPHKPKQPRFQFKYRTCEVCGREYKVYPRMTRDGDIRYCGPCQWCGSLGGRTGPLKVGHE